PSPREPSPPRPTAPAGASATHGPLDEAGWVDLVAGLALRGPVRELAAHAAFIDWSGGALRLSLPASDDHLKAPFLVAQLANALAPALGVAPQIRFDEAAVLAGETLHARTARERDERQAAAESAFLSDPQVQRLIQQQGARVVPDSIRPFDEA
ncbi:DNA polymerase III subunit gamma/tau C-terminal domain-containing protein, partial [Luteimonas sp. SDU101]